MVAVIQERCASEQREQNRAGRRHCQALRDEDIEARSCGPTRALAKPARGQAAARKGGPADPGTGRGGTCATAPTSCQSAARPRRDLADQARQTIEDARAGDTSGDQAGEARGRQRGARRVAVVRQALLRRWELLGCSAPAGRGGAREPRDPAATAAPQGIVTPAMMVYTSPRAWLRAVPDG